MRSFCVQSIAIRGEMMKRARGHRAHIAALALCALASSCGAPPSRSASAPPAARPLELAELPQTWQSPDPAVLEEARSQGFGEASLDEVERALAMDVPSAVVKFRRIAAATGITPQQASWLRAQGDAMAPHAMSVLQADFTAACAANDQRGMAAALLAAAELQFGRIDVGPCTPEANRLRMDAGPPGVVYWQVTAESVRSHGANGPVVVALRVRNVSDGRDAPYVLRSFGSQAAAFAETAPSLALIFGGPPRWTDSDVRRAHRWIGAMHIFLLGDGVMTPCANFTAPPSGGARSNVNVESPILLVRKGEEVEVRCAFRASGAAEMNRLLVLGAPPTPLPEASP